MNTQAATRDELRGPLDKMKQAAERNRHNGAEADTTARPDSPQASDKDPASPTGATAPNAWDLDPKAVATGSPGTAANKDSVAGLDQNVLVSSGSDQSEGAHVSKKPKLTDPASTDVILKVIGADDSNPTRLDARAPPAAASMRYQVNDEGNIALPPAGAAMDDADDPEEDNILQAGDGEYDDDVAAVAGDIMGVGPTWGTVAGDPTSNLGGLGLAKNLQDSLGDAGNDLAVPLVTPGSGTSGGTKGGTASDTGKGVGPGVTKGGTGGDAAAGTLSEGDADVRGRKVTSVTEDEELPLRDAADGAVGVGGGEQGSREGGMGVDTAAAAAAPDEEYPEGFDGLEPSAIADGDFKPIGRYVRHRSAGHTGVDPDPRQRKVQDPKKGLRDIGSLQGLGDLEVKKDIERELASNVTSSHPVEKGDFAMGTVAVPELTEPGSAAAVRGLEYTDEAKYAPEGAVGALEGPREGSAGIANVNPAADVGKVAAGTHIEGSGPVLIQKVGTEGVQQQRMAEASAAQPAAGGNDAKHLDAIFGQ